jgi:hypothetical protein
MKLKTNFLKQANLNFFMKKYFSGGHHHVTGKIDADRVFVPMPNQFQNKALFNVCGLPADKVDESSYHTVIEHGPKNLLNTNPFEIMDRPTKLADVPMEENPYVHEDAYGYTFGDDVSLNYKLIL